MQTDNAAFFDRMLAYWRSQSAKASEQGDYAAFAKAEQEIENYTQMQKNWQSKTE